MRVKTFLATYSLFLIILFSSFGFVSIYMMNNQIGMLMKKGAAEYQTIAASLSKDMAVLSGRSGDFYSGVETLVAGYVKYYASHNIRLVLTDFSSEKQQSELQDTKISFISEGKEHFVFVTGAMSEPFQNYRLDYYYDASQSISDTRNIQNSLLFVCVAVSVVTAFALHFITGLIFRPLDIIAKISRKIANGQYNERISVKGKNELAAMAGDFNKMAEEIETQIRLLEGEAINKQQFVDNFAHEIRTPLTSIYGYAEYMQKALLNEEEIIESAQYIMDEAGHMKKIANSLLELATLRNYKPTKSKIPIPRLFEEISQAMKKPLDEHKTQLICRGDADVLEGQEDLIKSLMLNLCANALNACSPGRGIIYLEGKRQTGKIVLSVSDNGCGMPQESVLKVTEPFYRADKVRSRDVGGAGLGLTLCKQIADAHGAKLDIESAEGLGTKINIEFTSS